MSVTIAIELPDQPDVAALIEMSDSFMAGLYPQEGNFAVDINALCQPDIVFVVARLDGKAVGCGGLKWLGDKTAEVKRIFVHDNARGHGVGRRIMGMLEDLAASHRIERVYLETGPLNTEAIGLYQGLGYRTCGAFAQYDENPYSLFMVKALEAA
ncbi:hypothetical protein ASG19_08570 [Rhizobium sp. Leaf306]|uniref:GNAT family N-acetyltransferase n=1 Tax=Rhizobium sp. Leaf306 TaxID=1736330 RepID=UPI000714A755|nr:GNAT family N-acetyltransferase [Rhizobium sp. Leaf306]KQQ36476.1 hypothetical protein ASG19_08570 [Rhizobium sp. Leaf306]